MKKCSIFYLDFISKEFKKSIKLKKKLMKLQNHTTEILNNLGKEVKNKKKILIKNQPYHTIPRANKK